jgi:hypothetical protein
MKTMLQKIQGLGQKAAQIAEAIEGAPAKIALAREKIHLTAGQLQLARTELQQVATGLHVENDEDFTNAFREIAENAAVFQQAGYDLAGIDLEVSHYQRLIVHLDRHTAVPEHTLRFLLTQNHSRVTIASILSSIIKAESLSQQVHAPDMEYRGLLVHLGATPGVRILWREIIQHVGSAPVAQAPIQVQTPAATISSQPAPTATSNISQGSFFNAPAQPLNNPAPVPAALGSEAMRIAPVTESYRQHESAKSLQGDWKKEAMERLKSSPGVSKYRR